MIFVLNWYCGYVSDEEIARKLQEEEDNAASTANVTPNLQTLMDMEYALQLCRHDPVSANMIFILTNSTVYVT